MSRSPLEALGWDARRDPEFTPHAAAGLEPARVVAQYNERYRLANAYGECDAVLSGRLRHEAATAVERPVTGDWVAASPAPDGGEAVVRALLPRRTLLTRGAVAAEETVALQPLAANVDTLFLVASLDREWNPRRLERYLTLAWESGARPVALLAKADLAEDPAAALLACEAVAPGVPVVVVSAVTGANLDAVRAHLSPGETAAFVGPSGVGKSTLVNALAGEEIAETGAVRDFDGKGRHTTTRRELVALPCGALLLDTPGLRELRMGDSADGLAGAFPDVEALAAGCRFRDCAHAAEPGCAVLAAVASGGLDPARLASYRKLAREIRRIEVKLDPRARLEESRRLRRFGRLVRDIGAERAARPRR